MPRLDAIARRFRHSVMSSGAASILKSKFIGVNWRGETFSTAICFAALALVKLCSSVVLTRLLYPEAYGIVAMLSSVMFIIEMLSDIGVIGLLIRHSRSDRPFLNTLWTIRLGRGVLNAVVLFFAAPHIAILYGAPELTVGLRLFAITFITHGFQSMAFLVAMRQKRARVVNYAELASTIVSTLFVLAYSWFSRDHYGMVFGVIVNSLLMTVLSYRVSGAFKPQFCFDRDAARDLFGFAKFVGPSSAITLALSQFERIVFLKFFDLQLLGLYGLATGISSPIEALIGKLSRFVLYPRCAENYRSEPATSRSKYYFENWKLFCLIMFLPAAVSGSADLIIRILFDHRYAAAGAIVQALCLRGMLSSLAAPAEDVLVAAGEARVVLVGNVLRLCWLVMASLGGYHYFGFSGFLYGASTDLLPALAYLLWKQKKLDMMIARYEVLKLGFLASSFLLAHLVSRQLGAVMPATW